MTGRKGYRAENSTIRSEGCFAVLCGLLLAGCLLGAMCLSIDSAAAERLSAGGLGLRTSGEAGRILSGSLMGSTVFLLGALLLGLSPVGQPFAGALLVFRGLGIGSMMAQGYAAVAAERVPAAAGMLLPGAAVSGLALVFAVRESWAMSGAFLGFSLSDRQVDGAAGELRVYATRALCLEAVCVVGAGLDCLMGMLLSGYV